MSKFLFYVSLLFLSVSCFSEEFVVPQYKYLTRARLSSLECLSVNLYMESRGESDIANLMVIAVVLNRVKDKRYPNDICEVVFEHKAFSWTSDGLVDYISDIEQYKRLYKLVEYAIMNKEFVLTLSEGVDHYHAKRIKPYWASSDKIKYITTIDNHVFYRWLKRGEVK